MANWESLIAERMRPCASMPKFADPTRQRKHNVTMRYKMSDKGKQARKGADARYREKHSQERREYNRNYYQAHREYFAAYREKLKTRKAA